MIYPTVRSLWFEASFAPRGARLPLRAARLRGAGDDSAQAQILGGDDCEQQPADAPRHARKANT
jgi:hypothetical protein